MTNPNNFNNLAKIQSEGKRIRNSKGDEENEDEGEQTDRMTVDQILHTKKELTSFLNKGKK